MSKGAIAGIVIAAVFAGMVLGGVGTAGAMWIGKNVTALSAPQGPAGTAERAGAPPFAGQQGPEARRGGMGAGRFGDLPGGSDELGPRGPMGRSGGGAEAQSAPRFRAQPGEPCPDCGWVPTATPVPSR